MSEILSRKSMILSHNYDFITVEDDKTDAQPAVDEVSSLNDAIADAIANVSAVNDNSLTA